MDFSEEDLRAQALALQSQLASEESEDFEAEEEESPRYVEFKKYVVRVDAQYIEMVEQLSYDERNLFFNELLEDYIKKDIEQEESQIFATKVKTIVLSVLFIIVGVPLLIWMLSASFDATHSNYKDMQDKFIKLYQSRDKY
jgi:hypothetical protein